MIRYSKLVIIAKVFFRVIPLKPPLLCVSPASHCRGLFRNSERFVVRYPCLNHDDTFT